MIYANSFIKPLDNKNDVMQSTLLYVVFVLLCFYVRNVLEEQVEVIEPPSAVYGE